MIVDLIEAFYRLLWGDLFTLPVAGGIGISFMVVLLFAAGIGFTLRTRLLPVRLFRDMIGAVCEKKQAAGGLSSFQTLVISTATRVGMGNLVGVVAAVSAGGAGAVFWMWVTALLGASTSFVESTLAQKYRVPDPLYGGWRGGPAYYLHVLAERKRGKKLRRSVCAALFAVSGLICWCGISQVISNSVSSAFENAFHVPPLATTVVLTLLAALIVLVLFLKFGRDKRYAPTVEFYPPEGLNSAEVGLWYKGKATNEMVLSLLVYLAQRNHIAIHPGKRKRDFVLTKCHGYVGQDTNLAVFMDGLFPDGRTRTDNKQLKNHFYETVGTIRADLNSTESRSRFFDKTSIYLKRLSFVLLALSAAGGAYFSHRALDDSLTLAPSILYAMLAGTLCLALGLIPACCMLRRTDEGAKTLAQIQGFRSFLVTAEKEKLEALVEQDPEYFYHILPYTYALGVSDKWIKKFESIAMRPPRWYNGTDVWSYVLFDRMLRDTLRAANDSMVSQPGGKAGSFVSGGGGFTGGGVGGGGGGSW